MKHYKIPFTYGIYGAILGFIFYLMLLFSGNSPWSSASWMGCWIPGITAYFSVKKFHSFDLKTSLSFLGILKIAIVAIFTQAATMNLITLLFNLIIETNAVEMYKTEVLQYAEQISAFVGEEMYNTMIKELEESTLISLTFGDFTNKIIGGIIVSLILAGILKKNTPSLATDE